MSEHTPGSSPAPRSLPDRPSLEWLRKEAKRRLKALRERDPTARLADAQLDLARHHGFPSWRALKARVDSLTVDGRLVEAARSGDVDALAALLAAHPARIRLRTPPYEWTLLHHAAQHGRAEVVALLLRLGLDVNARERGDRTYAMHWAAAAGHLEVVRLLADAGGDVIGRGDDHELEVIGWATCWDPPHPEVAELLLSRGARHHVISAVALGLADEVRRIVAADPAALTRPMSRNENHQLPLHFAVRKNLPEMVELLLELGADPRAPDGSGGPTALYAAEPTVDRRILEALARHGGADLFIALVLGDEEAATRELGGGVDGALHLAAKRGDAHAVRWLLERGADPTARAPHWDAIVTPLHLAASRGHHEVVRLLLDAGADPRVRDSKHDSDAIGWAEFFRWPEIARLLVEGSER